jgi:hypothetical protein
MERDGAAGAGAERRLIIARRRAASFLGDAREAHGAERHGQLAELERGAGEVLREEREATRALSLCAIGDTAGARRVAAPLLSGGASSIYGPRLDASCAREDEGVRN